MFFLRLAYYVQPSDLAGALGYRAVNGDERKSITAR